MSKTHLISLAWALTFASAVPAVAMADDVGIRNLQVLRISNAVKNISAVGQNNTDRTLPAVQITYELSDKDGNSLGIQTHEYTEIGPQQAWRISHTTAAPNVAALKILKIETPAIEAEPDEAVETAELHTPQ